MSITDKYYPIITTAIPQGWMLKEKFEWFEKIYSENKISIAVESGVFYGQSAIAQGVIIKELGLDCKLYAIDAWSSEASAEGSNSEANKEWWTKQIDYQHCYKSFLKSVREFGLSNIIEPIKLKSEDAVDVIPNEIDLFHQDSNHCKEVISKEMELYVPKMAKGGWWICDDFLWKEANETYLKISDYGFMQITTFDKEGQSFAIYKKNR